MRLREESGINADMAEDFSGPAEEDEVGLRAYVLTLVAWWREIVLGVLIAAAAGGLVQGAASPKYETTIGVAVMHQNLSFAQSLKGLTDTGRRSNRQIKRIEMNTIVGLAEQEGITEKVVEALGGRLGPVEALSAADRKKRLPSVSADTVPPLRPGRYHVTDKPSNLVRITVRADSPEKAVLFANAWAEEYTAAVNRLYDRTPPSLHVKIQAMLQDAMTSYKNAQAELEAFLAESTLARLVRMKRENEKKIHRFMSARQRLSDDLDDARNLRFQIMQGGEAGVASNNLAIRLFKLRIYSRLDELSKQVDIRFDEAQTIYPDVSAQMADIDAVIAVLETNLKELEHAQLYAPLTMDSSRDSSSGPSNADGRRSDENDRPVSPSRVAQTPRSSDSFTAGRPPLRGAVAKLEEANRLLDAKEEYERSRQRYLTKARNQARSFLETLQNTTGDLELISAITIPIAQVVSPVTPPRRLMGNPPGFTAAVFGVAAFLCLIFLVFFMNLLGVRPFFGRRGTERSRQT